jgi:predicted nucleotidyltransferase
MEQSELLQFVVGVLERLTIRYAIVGSFASGVWGETRFTQDIDIVVQLDRFNAALLVNQFADGNFYISHTAVDEAVELGRPFNVIHPESGNKIDFMVVHAHGWNELQLKRRIKVDFSASCSGFVAAPEDVILGKLIYYKEGGSEKHLRDIAGILKVSKSQVDRAYINEQTLTLGLSDNWRSVVKAIE